MTGHTADRAALELDRAWIYKVSVLADLVARRVGEAVTRVSALNLSQWRVIAALADEPGRTASQVVAVTPMDKAVVSRAVAAMVRDGFIERRASAADGRVSHLFLTPSGDAAYAAIVDELERTGADGRALLEDAAERPLIAALDDLIARYRGGR